MSAFRCATKLLRNETRGGTFAGMTKGARIMRPKNIAGAVARGADFWGREADVDELWRVLARGSTLLSAPRRWGKSSLMWALRDAPRAGWTVVDLDVEYVETPIEFLTELTAALLQQDAFARLFKSAKKAPGALMRWISGAVDEVGVGELKFKLRAGLEKQDNWHDLAEQLLGYMRNVEGQLLVIIDEFPARVVLAELTSNADRTIDQLHFALTQRGQSEIDIDRLVAMLEGDYYVSREADRVSFSSRFLRDWWLRNAPGPRRRS